MHENRETSEMPAAQLGCRTAGEGSGHTARVYVPEESHSGVVPMNHSNKDRTSLAESEEGRVLIEEDTMPNHAAQAIPMNKIAPPGSGIASAASEPHVIQNATHRSARSRFTRTVTVVRPFSSSLNRRATPLTNTNGFRPTQLL